MKLDTSAAYRAMRLNAELELATATARWESLIDELDRAHEKVKLAREKLDLLDSLESE